MALKHIVTRGYSTGSNDGTVNLVVTRGYAAGAAVVEVATPSGGGGILVRSRRRRTERPSRDVATARTQPRAATFRPLIPDTATTQDSKKPPNLPALLAAWMAFDDD